ALLGSDELRDLATRFGVVVGQLEYLQQLVGAAKSLIAGPGGRVVSAESQQQSFAAALAVHFFHWLRKQVLEVCERLPATGLKYDAIPVRLTVPAFALENGTEANSGCKVLRDALDRTGWPIHPTRPLVSEPYSNAIGVLTQGSNVLRSSVRIGDMFGKGAFMTVMRDATHHPIYRALVIDVGAFTTDFAAVTLKPEGDNTSDPDADISVAQQSVPLGISNLDTAVAEALPKDQTWWLNRPLDLEDFQVAVYTEGKGFSRPERGVVGGPAHAELIHACLTQFGKQLTAETSQFVATLPSLPSGALQELILTGGGSNIPTIREALQTSAQSNGQTYFKIYAPALKKITGGPRTEKLDTSFTRGGSALGGASIYFEKDYY
ncbi:MAG: hypothetical protein L0241_31450, partial [Planctomycetia bacterium]|nr:hypothetical protein [Planctomycetia bacterium]